MIPTKKNIAIIHPNVTKKWWAVYMMILLWNLLKKRGNNVELYTFSYNKDLFWKDIDFNVNVSSKIKIAYSIRKSDYIWIWNSPMQFVWVLSKILFFSKAKLFWWHHHYPWYYEGSANIFISVKKILEKFSLYWIDELIANSKYIQKSLKTLYKRESKILYPVLDNYFLSQAYKEVSNFRPTILSYGRWEKWKNIKQIFTTYQSLKKQIPNLELRIWGIGEELEFFKKQYKLDASIKFLWLLDKKNIVDNLRQSNVFLFPSTIDSFGLSAVEALSIWTPVVWFSWKWLNEVIQNNKNWYLVNSVKEFTEKTFYILNNKELYISLSKNAIHTSKQFSLTSFEETLEKIF